MSELHEAVRKRDGALVERLIQGGFLRGQADVNEKDRRSGNTPLGIAASAGHIQLAKLLLENGADAGALDGSGNRPLGIAVAGGHIELAKLLLDSGAAANAPDGSGERPLWMAIARGHAKLADLLVGYGANVNASRDGETLLHLAVGRGHVQLAKWLIEKGADKAAPGRYGKEKHMQALYLFDYSKITAGDYADYVLGVVTQALSTSRGFCHFNHGDDLVGNAKNLADHARSHDGRLVQADMLTGLTPLTDPNADFAGGIYFVACWTNQAANIHALHYAFNQPAIEGYIGMIELRDPDFDPANWNQLVRHQLSLPHMMDLHDGQCCG